ncbi:hypothetical protein ACFO5W_08520, partial [Dyella halodurans]
TGLLALYMPAARFSVWNAIRLKEFFGLCCDYLNHSTPLRDASHLTHASNAFHLRRIHRPRPAFTAIIHSLLRRTVVERDDEAPSIQRCCRDRMAFTQRRNV